MRISINHLTIGVVLFIFLVCIRLQAGECQDLEPRAYSPAPIGTNFLFTGYAYSDGSASVNPTLPVSNIKATVHTGMAGYSGTFAIFRRMASVAMVVPYLDADVSGEVKGEDKAITRAGMGDMRFRIATNPIGGKAMTPDEFAHRVPTTSLGTSLSVIAPTGDYDSTRLVNIGTNRWTFKPEVGISQPLGNWFAEAAAGVSFFTDNDNFFNGQHRQQAPLASYQIHGGYNFQPGLWLALDATYYNGGETKVDGVQNLDRQSNSRYGMTLSLPLSREFSLKFTGSRGLVTRIGGDFTTYSAMLQYRWFD